MGARERLEQLEKDTTAAEIRIKAETHSYTGILAKSQKTNAQAELVKIRTRFITEINTAKNLVGDNDASNVFLKEIGAINTDFNLSKLSQAGIKYQSVVIKLAKDLQTKIIAFKDRYADALDTFEQTKSSYHTAKSEKDLESYLDQTKRSDIQVDLAKDKLNKTLNATAEIENIIHQKEAVLVTQQEALQQAKTIQAEKIKQYNQSPIHNKLTAKKSELRALRVAIKSKESELSQFQTKINTIETDHESSKAGIERQINTINGKTSSTTEEIQRLRTRLDKNSEVTALTNAHKAQLSLSSSLTNELKQYAALRPFHSALSWYNISTWTSNIAAVTFKVVLLPAAILAGISGMAASALYSLRFLSPAIRKEKKELQKSIDDVKKAIESLVEEIAELRVALPGNTAEMDTQALTKLNGELDALNTKNTALESQLERLQSRFNKENSQLNDSLSTKKTEIEALNNASSLITLEIERLEIEKRTLKSQLIKTPQRNIDLKTKAVKTTELDIKAKKESDLPKSESTSEEAARQYQQAKITARNDALNFHEFKSQTYDPLRSDSKLMFADTDTKYKMAASNHQQSEEAIQDLLSGKQSEVKMPDQKNLLAPTLISPDEDTGNSSSDASSGDEGDNSVVNSQVTPIKGAGLFNMPTAPEQEAVAPEQEQTVIRRLAYTKD